MSESDTSAMSAKQIGRTPWPLLVAALVAPGAVVFVFPMLRLIAQNDEYFDNRYWFGRYVYAAAVVLIAIGVATWAISRTTVGRVAFTAYLLLAPAWTLYTILEGPDSLPVVVLLAVATLVALVVVAHRLTPDVLRGFGMLGAVLMLGAAAAAVPEMVSNSEPEIAGAGTSNGRSAAGERLPNVYHVILDEFQTDILEVLLDRFEARTTQALNGFTLYEDAITTYGRTGMAVPSIFSGDDYNYDEPPEDFVKDAFSSSTSALARLRDAGYVNLAFVPKLSIYGGALFDEVTVHPADAPGASDAGYDDLATSIWIYSNFPQRVSVELIPARLYQQLDGQVLLPDDAAPISVYGFRQFLRQEPRLSATGRYTFVHLILPHFPYVLDSDCAPGPDTETGPVEQAGCAVTLVQELADVLEELDRFEESVVVIHGDHGARYEVDGRRVIDIQDNGLFSDEFSTARARAVLLVKPPGARADEPLRRSPRPALLTDIMPTILDAVTGTPPPSRSGRASLLGDDFPRRAVRYYHFYNKATNDLPDDEVSRYEVRDGRATLDRTIPTP